LHVALMLDRCHSNGDDYPSNFGTLETTCQVPAFTYSVTKIICERWTRPRDPILRLGGPYVMS